MLLPYKMFLTEEGGKAHRFASLFIDMFRSPQSCKIRFLTAVTVVIFMHLPCLITKLGYTKIVAVIGYACYYIVYM